MLRFCRAGSRLAMTMLAVAPPRIAALSFDLRAATPVPSIVIARSGSSPLQSLPNQAFNAHLQHAASAEIPIASDAPPQPISRGFLPWRFADAGPATRRTTFMGPASENLHRLGHARHGPLNKTPRLTAGVRRDVWPWLLHLRAITCRAASM